jgi:hypothetical protein
MVRYLIVLSDMEGNPDYMHPSELYGSSKNEVYNLISENVPPENIVGIYSENEYKKLMQSPRTAALLNAGNQEQSGQAFFNSMLNAATALAEEQEKENQVQEQQQRVQLQVQESVQQKVQQQLEKQIISEQSVKQEIPVKQQTITSKIFVDNGIEFKLENGKLYKKCWQTIKAKPIDENSTEIVFDNYRIVNKDTGKPIKNRKYEIQVLDWELIQSE